MAKAKPRSRKSGPSLSVGRGEKLSVKRGGGLTAKGRAKYNKATRLLRLTQKRNQRNLVKNHSALDHKAGRVNVARLRVKGGSVKCLR